MRIGSTDFTEASRQKNNDCIKIKGRPKKLLKKH